MNLSVVLSKYVMDEDRIVRFGSLERLWDDLLHNGVAQQINHISLLLLC